MPKRSPATPCNIDKERASRTHLAAPCLAAAAAPLSRAATARSRSSSWAAAAPRSAWPACSSSARLALAACTQAAAVGGQACLVQPGEPVQKTPPCSPRSPLPFTPYCTSPHSSHLLRHRRLLPLPRRAQLAVHVLQLRQRRVPLARHRPQPALRLPHQTLAGRQVLQRM